MAPSWLPTTPCTLNNVAAQAASSRAVENLDGHLPSNDQSDDLDRLTSMYAAEAATSSKHVMEQHQGRQSQKSMVQLRKDGLSKPLEADNRGYRLLTKMGYKAGQGLGSSANGRPVPIDVDLKASKAGLGVDEARKRRQRDAEVARRETEIKRAKTQERSQVSFRENTVTKFSAASAERHLSSARKSIETLDERASVQRHHMWPCIELPPEALERTSLETPDTVQSCSTMQAVSETDTWEMLPAAQRLAEAAEYLRSRYSYCIYCGCKFEDPEDMGENCPGIEESDH